MASGSGSSRDGKLESKQVLIKTRGYTRQRITKLCNKIDSEYEGITEEQSKYYIEKVRALQRDLNDVDSNLIKVLIKTEADEDLLDETIQEQDEYEEMLLLTLSRLQAVSTNNNAASTPLINDNFFANAGSLPAQNRLRLPEVPLPIFSNAKNDDYEKFVFSFESFVNKHNLTSYEKFVYLRNQLRGAPRALIDSLDTDSQSFENAKELLGRAFASSVTQKYNAIRRLSELKLAAKDPYNYIGDMRSIINSFKNLNIDVNTILTYFIWKGLDTSFQNHLMQIVNTNKPSLKQIESKIFEAAERYVRCSPLTDNLSDNKYSIKSNDAKFGNTTNLAVNVSGNKYNICNLCKFDNVDHKHPMYKCTIYNTAKLKIDKLKIIGACTKCSFRSHDSRDCKFVFSSKCRNCDGSHMTFLCYRNDSSLSKRSNINNDGNTRTQNCANNISWSEALVTIDRDEPILLPTLTAKLLGDNNYKNVRILKDGGCQRNFVKEAVAELLKFPIIDNNLKLQVHGFNSSKIIQTKAVEVSMQYDDRIIKLNAVCVPEIRTSIAVPNLGVLTDGFESKGYVLADRFITNKCRVLNGFELILGADSDQYIDMKYVKFGSDEDCSCYISTPVGIIFTGNLTRNIANLEYLPFNSSVNCNDVKVLNEHITKEDSFEKEGEEFKFKVSDLVKCRTKSDYNDNEGLITNDNKDFSVLNKKGDIVEDELLKATEHALNKHCSNLLHETNDYDCIDTDTNDKIINYVLHNTKRDESGRLVMPLVWNAKISHRLGQNFILCKKILQSNRIKLEKSDNLLIYDNVFREQEREGFIEKIHNIDKFVQEHPEASFLAHMGVFKPDRDTTKCRVVFLSNLCDNKYGINSVSHNQAMLPGPCLNNKITTSLIFLRFDKFLLTFDIRKAFLNIALPEHDQVKLLFLWYNNIKENDYSLVGYKNKVLTFGLRPSPCILMLALYKILMLDNYDCTADIIELKRSVFHNIYMDNGAYSTNNSDKLLNSFQVLPDIFEPYKFQLQQYVTNLPSLQGKIDERFKTETPSVVKLLGMLWDRVSDNLMPHEINFNIRADTKRLVLQSINSVYDIFGIYAPLLNRAKLFLQKLQSDKSLDWDTKLNCSLQKEWSNVVKQVRNLPITKIERYIGDRSSEYSLIAFTDSSKLLYGVVVYIMDLKTSKVSFLLAKSRVIGKQLENKTIPALEFHAIAFGVEVLTDLWDDLCGNSAVIPLNIVSLELYTDSMVALHWLNAYATKFEKMQRMSVFIMNRLKTIDNLCTKHPVTFRFTEGTMNPADAVSRPLSYKKLCETCYYTGPEILNINKLSYSRSDTISVLIPNPNARVVDEIPECDTLDDAASSATQAQVCCSSDDLDHIIPVEKYSEFRKLVNVTKNVLLFINNIKLKLHRKQKLLHLIVYDERNIYCEAYNRILHIEQRKKFPDVFSYFSSENKSKRTIPDLVSKYNLFICEKDSLIRVKSKFAYTKMTDFPILLPKESAVTSLIIESAHRKLGHSGIYSVLNSLKSNYWILHYFSVVRSILRKCITCCRYNARAVKLNQSKYRDFRVSPSEIPFSTVFLDYMGPWKVKYAKDSRKVYILIITCLFTRAVNLKVCLSADVADFLRAIQSHIYQYGLFSQCRSDLGSQITAGFNLVKSFLNDYETRSFFQQHNVDHVEFTQFPKGNSALGSLVESLVKQTKLLINKSIKTNVLDIFDFQFLIDKVTHLVNRRPIAFKECLSSEETDISNPITPEMLVHGYELLSLNVIPELHYTEEDSDWSDSNLSYSQCNANIAKLKKVRQNVIDNYHSEFLTSLTSQATNKSGRYSPVPHDKLSVGDVVLLKEKFHKPTNYPLGKINKVEINSLGETTAAYVLKGNTKEVVYRHASSIIPLIKNSNTISDADCTDQQNIADNALGISRPARDAARRSEALTKALADKCLT